MSDGGIRGLGWRLVGRHLFAMSPTLAHGFRRGLLRMAGGSIDPRAKIRRSAMVDRPWNLTLGALTVVGDDAVLRSRGAIRIGQRCVVSQLAVLSTEQRVPGRDDQVEPIHIEDDCWVAADAMVLPGSTIRAGAVVGARSVVQGELPGWQVCVGHPARPIRAREFNAPNEPAPGA
jgi:putative colanic acid biosynthesis acetyltransferase WcaF